jgi:hypothetical protein
MMASVGDIGVTLQQARDRSCDSEAVHLEKAARFIRKGLFRKRQLPKDAYKR